MPAHVFFDVPDPLKDRFTYEELPKLAPWVAERIEMIGRDKVAATIGASGQNPHGPLLMSAWVAAIRKTSSPIDEAFAA